ncbi:MAG: hypothetical protein COX79_02300 [Candidatus Levybacteria bacterium CG_4_10_14_0_2_um_filter_36_16]|nr:MAG: hypothetical protein AUK12_02745 [Candidatus Levybacteria bacterium CG2_30_37_29]PIZ97408.1 MAG: hypothetical protein COX79_02300 [Candidatus Levybacteria bacterium CG_4_10_14_0_2_um_filter_36_16]
MTHERELFQKVSPPETHNAAKSEKIDVSDKRVWVVEGFDPGLRRIHEEVLKRSRFTKVSTFNSRSELLEYFEETERNDRPELIVTDFQRKDRTSVKEVMDETLVPVVVMTGGMTQDEATQLLAMGVLQIIRKPYVPNEFIETIENALRSNSQKPPTP